jgi:hypothetical protein
MACEVRSMSDDQPETPTPAFIRKVQEGVSKERAGVQPSKPENVVRPQPVQVPPAPANTAEPKK